MQALKLKPRPTVSIAVDPNPTASEVAYTNGHVATTLLKMNNVQLDGHAIPEKDGDVFRRRVIASKIVKKRAPSDDLPDLSDLSDTNLPWAGHLTFVGAHRQFRSKFVLAAVCDIVRMYDGFLYHLSVATPGRDYKAHPFCLINIPPVDIREQHCHVTIDRHLDYATVERHFSNAEDVPRQLILELVRLGYVLEGNVFSHPQFTGIEGRIRCDLWGKVITNQPLREVK